MQIDWPFELENAKIQVLISIYSSMKFDAPTTKDSHFIPKLSLNILNQGDHYLCLMIWKLSEYK